MSASLVEHDDFATSRPTYRRTAAQTVRLYLREAVHEFLMVLRMPAFALPTLAFPAVFYAVFGLLLPGQWPGVTKSIYLLATYGTFGIIGPALFGFGVGVAIEREKGWLQLKRVSPMPMGAYFFGKMAMSMMFAMIVLLILSSLSLAAGKVIAFDAWLRLMAVLIVGTLPFCAMGLCIGTMARGSGAAAIVNLVYLPMGLLSGLWIPLFVFPDIVSKLASIWPSYHLAQIALGMAGEIDGVRYGLHVAVLLLFTVMFATIAAKRLREEG